MLKVICLVVIVTVTIKLSLVDGKLNKRKENAAPPEGNGKCEQNVIQNIHNIDDLF